MGSKQQKRNLDSTQIMHIKTDIFFQFPINMVDCIQNAKINKINKNKETEK